MFLGLGKEDMGLRKGGFEVVGLDDHGGGGGFVGRMAEGGLVVGEGVGRWVEGAGGGGRRWG